MRSIWSARTTPLKLKLRIYKTGVCSRLTYGSEAWRLDTKACALLNGANSQMMARITNKSAHEEASSATRTFDIVSWIRARRLQWVGHILRMDQDRLVFKAARYIADHRTEGDLLMDTPANYSWQELQDLAKDRVGWRARVASLRNRASPSTTNNNTTPAVTITINPSLPGCRAHCPPCSPTPSPSKPPPSPSKLMARRYLQRQIHAAFFSKGPARNQYCRKRKRSKASSSKPFEAKLALTKKQRAAAARAQYEQNHGPTSLPLAPPILGHHCDPHTDSPFTPPLDRTLPLSPPALGEMLNYCDNISLDHENLKNLSNLI